MDSEELILCCDCMSINHICRFNYFPLSKDEKPGEDDVIFASIPLINLASRIIPPFNFYLYDWDNYFRFHFFKRFYHSFLHIIKSYYNKDGIMDTIIFQKKDLSTLYNYLEFMSKEKIDKDFQLIKNETYKKDFQICFYAEEETTRNNFFHPRELTFSINFQKGNLWRRIRTAFNYIVGNISESFNFEIRPDEARKLRGIIKYIEETNEKR